MIFDAVIRLQDAMSPDENHSHDSRLGPAVAPAVPGTVLHHGVAGAKHLLGAVVQFQDYLTGENHLEVDGVGRVHPGVVWLHVAEEPRQRASWTSRRRDGEHAETVAAQRREIAW